jgi:flagellar hook-associated protein 3 FlgL
MAVPRLSNQMMARNTLADINHVANDLYRTQRKMSSGKEITKPSDDPFGTTRAVSARRDLEEIQQLKKNVDDALSWQGVTEVALARLTDVVQRSRELLVQGASDSNSAQQREAIAKEIDQLIETAKTEANGAYGGRYIFAGTQTNTKPYNVGGTDVYNGDGGNIVRTIGPAVSIAVNVRGADFLGGDPAVAQPDGLLLSTLRDVATHLRAGTPAAANALRGADIQALDRNLDNLTALRATVGATTNRLETAVLRLRELEEASTEDLNQIEGADMAKTLTDFSLQQAVYQSALKTGANIVQNSLLDFLR